MRVSKRRTIAGTLVSAGAVAGLVLGLSAVAGTRADAATFTVKCDKKGGPSIQDRHDKNAGGGDTILVSGACTENVTISKDGIRLMAAPGGASITAATATLPVIRVRGSRTRIIGFTLVGGSYVIQVQEGGSAIIEDNDISGAATGSGVLVTQNSYARVGGNTPSQGNDIHHNFRGITVRLGSGADVFHNTIDNNDRGLNIVANGAVDLADNVISNSTRGVSLLTGGTLTISAVPATTGGPNTFVNNVTALRCRVGGSASGGVVPVPQIDGGGNGTLLDLGQFFPGSGGCHIGNGITF